MNFSPSVRLADTFAHKHSPSMSSPALRASCRDDATPLSGCVVGRDGSRTPATFARGRFLGKGGFARCYALRRIDSESFYSGSDDADAGELLAGKCVLKSALARRRAREKLAAEVRIQRALSHENIVTLRGVLETPTHVVLLLELVSAHFVTAILHADRHHQRAPHGRSHTVAHSVAASR